ncbi:MAG: shikimate kinase [Alphaproteobacteria bacterium]|nr:shikimate kinase [Alphaproteobacteria bacterium]
MSDLSPTTADFTGHISHRLSKPLVLVGMMGSGKSHAGSLLASALSLEHYDSDKLIEKDRGRTISDIFSQDGEAAFRALERQKILHLLSSGPCVISTGGGCVTVPDILSAIRAQAVSVWLRADIDVLYERLKRSKNRPLMDCEDPKERLKTLMAQREALYAQADLIVDDPQAGIDGLVYAVLKALDGYLDR